MASVQQILKNLRKTAGDLEMYEQECKRETDRLEAALVSLTTKFIGVQQEKTRLEKENAEEVAQLREYVHQLVAHIKRVEVAMSSFDSGQVARRLHDQNNSWLVPDAIERRIYEEAVDQMSGLIRDIVRLPEDQSQLTKE